MCSNLISVYSEFIPKYNHFAYALGSMTSQCPVKVKQAAFLIKGSQTEFLVADYGSDCFVQITQV